MSGVRLLDQTSDVPADFDPDEALGGSFGIAAGEEIWLTLRASHASADPRSDTTR
jgi:hypothetical protein